MFKYDIEIMLVVVFVFICGVAFLMIADDQTREAYCEELNASFDVETQDCVIYDRTGTFVMGTAPTDSPAYDKWKEARS